MTQPHSHTELLEDILERFSETLHRIDRRTERMAIDQATFDTDLAALVQAITDLTTAVDALIASKGTADLSAEDASVQAASAAVAAELGKLAPPAA